MQEDAYFENVASDSNLAMYRGQKSNNSWMENIFKDTIYSQKYPSNILIELYSSCSYSSFLSYSLLCTVTAFIFTTSEWTALPQPQLSPATKAHQVIIIYMSP